MSLVFPNESYAIRGAAMRVYNVLGSGFLEAVYQEALEIELEKRNIPYEKEKELEIYYDGIKLGKKYIADFVCYDKIILELKAQEKLTMEHQYQVLNYLNITQNKLGLLINFGESPLKFKRLIL